MKADDRIYVAGHRGMVGSALVRRLQADGFNNLLLRTPEELDLTDQRATLEFFRNERPDYVFLAAARVGGILANQTYPADFIRDNLAIETNVIHAAHQAGVLKLMFFASSCAYPRLAPQPLKEEYLLEGAPEPSSAPYAVAKIAGIMLCQAYHQQHGDPFFALMPSNLYGPNDNFDLQTSHVMPALIRKFHEAKLKEQPQVTVWGTGTGRREFLHVDDLADAALFLMPRLQGGELINVGVGKDISIRELVELLRRITGYAGAVVWDDSMPDGAPRKLLDTARLTALGWSAQIPLEEGIRAVSGWFVGRTLLV
ncbi:MAG: GDP-L-fucose synthase family protein [Longimicrobiales bacterium]